MPAVIAVMGLRCSIIIRRNRRKKKRFNKVRMRKNILLLHKKLMELGINHILRAKRRVLCVLYSHPGQEMAGKLVQRFGLVRLRGRVKEIMIIRISLLISN